MAVINKTHEVVRWHVDLLFATSTSNIQLVASTWPTESKDMHLQEHAVMGHSRWFLNHSDIWFACPPCLHVWHQVNQLDIVLSFWSLDSSIFSSALFKPKLPDDVPIWIKHSAHRGNGFRHPGQHVIFDLLAIFPTDFPKGLVLPMAWSDDAIDFPQKLQLIKTCWGALHAESNWCQWTSNKALWCHNRHWSSSSL